jgi:hypothetical protein
LLLSGSRDIGGIYVTGSAQHPPAVLLDGSIISSKCVRILKISWRIKKFTQKGSVAIPSSRPQAIRLLGEGAVGEAD